MKFVSIRELRSKTAVIRDDLRQAREIVITANGRPFAVLTPVSAETVEEEVLAIRRARARAAIDRVRASAKAAGADKLTTKDIETEIAAARRTRRGR